MQTIKVSKSIWERRQLPKFGQCAGAPPGPENNITTIAPDWLELRCAPPNREQEVKDERTNIDSIVEQKAVIRCSNCGEAGHYSLSCPKRKELGPADTAAPRPDTSNKYVPSFLRNASEREEETSLRISNLPEETMEYELEELLYKISRSKDIEMPKRVFLVMDKVNPQISRGFAFVHYSSSKDAKVAQATIDGYRFNTMVLEAAFSAPREDRPRTKENRRGGPSDNYEERASKDFAVSRPWRSK